MRSAARVNSPQAGALLGARPASGMRAPPSAADGQAQLTKPPSAGLARPGSSSSTSRNAGGGTNILGDGPGARSGRRAAVPLLGGADSSDDDDAPIQVCPHAVSNNVRAFLLAVLLCYMDGHAG
jgi:hypothetical protein